MSVIDTTEAPVLAAPRRPEGRVSLRQFLQVIRDNVLATYAPEDFDRDFIARRLLWRRTFIINKPGGAGIIGTAAVASRRFNWPNGMSGFGRSPCSEPGRMPCSSASIAFKSPAIPEAGSR